MKPAPTAAFGPMVSFKNILDTKVAHKGSVLKITLFVSRAVVAEDGKRVRCEAMEESDMGQSRSVRF